MMRGLSVAYMAQILRKKHNSVPAKKEEYEGPVFKPVFSHFEKEKSSPILETEQDLIMSGIEASEP